MSAHNWACWAWKDEAGVVRYIGYGSFTNGHPARTKWANRDEDDSPLHQWLQLHLDEPEREVCGASILTKKMAIALATIYRDRYKATILQSRGPMSYHGGGHSRGVVYFPDDVCDVQIYASVREASRETRIAASNITRRCQNPHNQQWHYMIEYGAA